MKKIAVVGLGIIGGSMAGALTKAGYAVDGFNRSEKALAYARKGLLYPITTWYFLRFRLKLRLNIYKTLRLRTERSFRTFAG